MIESKYKDVMAEVEEAEQTIKEMEVEKEAKWALHKELKAKEVELTKAREEKLKDIDRAVSEAKKEAAVKTEQAMAVGNSAETLKLELEALEKDVVAAGESVESMKKASLKAGDERVEVSRHGERIDGTAPKPPPLQVRFARR